MALFLDLCEEVEEDLDRLESVVQAHSGHVAAFNWSSSLVQHMSDVADDVGESAATRVGPMDGPSGARVLVFRLDWQLDGYPQPEVTVWFAVNAENVVHADRLVILGIYHEPFDDQKRGGRAFAERRSGACAALAGP